MVSMIQAHALQSSWYAGRECNKIIGKGCFHLEFPLLSCKKRGFMSPHRIRSTAINSGSEFIDSKAESSRNGVVAGFQSRETCSDATEPTYVKKSKTVPVDTEVSHVKLPSDSSSQKFDPHMFSLELDDTFPITSFQTWTPSFSDFGSSDTVKIETKKSHNSVKEEFSLPLQEIAPWGEYEPEDSVTLQAPRFHQPRGHKPPKKNPYKGRKAGSQEEKLLEIISEETVEREARLSQGIIEAKDANELSIFLTANSRDIQVVRVVKLLEACFKKKCGEKAIQIIEFHAKLSNSPLRARGFTKLMRVAAQCGDMDSTLKLFDILKNRPESGTKEVDEGAEAGGLGTIDVFAYNIVMNAYAKLEQWEESLQLMEELRSGTSAVLPDAFSYSVAINVAVKGRRMATAIELFREMRTKHFKPDVVTFTSVAIAFCELGKPSNAEQLLVDMGVENVTPDTTFCTVLLNGYASKGESEEVMRVEKEMEASGCKRSQHTFTTLMDFYGKQGQVQKVEKLHVEMLREAIPLSLPTFNVLIATYAKNRQLAKAEALVRQMGAASCPPNARTFAELMSGYSNEGKPEEAEAVYSRMVSQHRVGPTAHTMAILVAAWAARGDVERAEFWVREMEEKGLGSSAAYHALMCCQGYMKGDLRAVLKLLEAFLAGGYEVTSRTWGACVVPFANVKQFRKMWVVWKKLVKAGKRPEASACINILLAFGRFGKVEGARKFLETVVAGGYLEGMEGPESLFNAMLKVYRDAGKVEEMEALFAQMSREGCKYKADVVTYNTMLNAFGKTGQLQKMEDLFRSMQSQGISPNKISFGSIISAYGRHKEFSRMLSWLGYMRDVGFEPNRVIYNSIIAEYSSHGYHQKAHDWFMRMREAGLMWNQASFHGRIRGFLKMGRTREAEVLMKEMEAEGFRVDPKLLMWLEKVRSGKVWGMKGVVKVREDGVQIHHTRVKRKGSGGDDRLHPIHPVEIALGIGSRRERVGMAATGSGRREEERAERLRSTGSGSLGAGVDGGGVSVRRRALSASGTKELIDAGDSGLDSMELVAARRSNHPRLPKGRKEAGGSWKSTAVIERLGRREGNGRDIEVVSEESPDTWKRVETARRVPAKPAALNNVRNFEKREGGLRKQHDFSLGGKDLLEMAGITDEQI